MSNEELAARVQDGEAELIFTLWERVRKLLYLIAHRYYLNNKNRARQKGLTLEDLEQESFFILLKAIQAYDPKKEFPFTSYFRYIAKNHLNELLGFRTAKGYKDILSGALSMETPIGDDLILSDTIADEGNPFEGIEKEIDNAIARDDLNHALESLNALQRTIIADYYFEGRSTAELAEIHGKTKNAIAAIRQEALRKLRLHKVLKRYRERTIQKAYWGGFGFWNAMGSSSTEYTALKLVEGEKKIKEKYAENLCKFS